MNRIARSLLRMTAGMCSFVLNALTSCILLVVPLPALGQTPPITFALIGDLGYTPAEEPALANVLADINRDTWLAFVVHVGDLASPRRGCTDGVLEHRLEQFKTSAHPFIYTPGDNEWTDCHEPAVKDGDPLERLTKVRAMFFNGERTLGLRTFPVNRQSEGPAFAKYRENARWELGGVTFLTLHVVGSNNGRGRTPEGNAEYAERNKANLAWLRQGFAHARATDARAIMVLQQANIFPEYAPFPGKPAEPSGLAETRAVLQKEAAAFGKPVVLVHGDSHYFRIDKPMSPRPGGPVMENFTRVEPFGSPYHHWVHVTIDPDDPNVFTFRPRMVPANANHR
jgi:hypothetical protein